MTTHPPLAKIVDEHIARAQDRSHLVRRTPIQDAAEHLDANGAPLYDQERVGVTLGRVAAESTARDDLAVLEARAAELAAARDRINAEAEAVQGEITAWHKTNGHGNAAADEHLFAHHGQHTYLGLDDPNTMLAERDAQIARLQAELDNKEDS